MLVLKLAWGFIVLFAIANNIYMSHKRFNLCYLYYSLVLVVLSGMYLLTR